MGRPQVVGQSRAGFVLASGHSSRMGRDKALLPAGSRTLLEQAADYVKQAAGNVTLAPPERYSFLGLPVIPDFAEDLGPLEGLVTALRNTKAEWNLAVDCDMPGLTPQSLRTLLEVAEEKRKQCLVPSVAGGLERLCAVYHAGALPAAENALARKTLLRNNNTPQEFRTNIAAKIP